MISTPADVTAERIAATHALIEPYVRRTPVLFTAPGDFGLTADALAFKLESLQYSGSFKARGAVANLLLRDVPPAGVVAASGGNHGAAVAFVARRLGVAANIFVPAISSPAKIERIRSYGAQVHVGGDRYADALVLAETWTAENGAIAVHAYDSVETMLGAGTTAREFDDQVPELDTLLVAVGGGGLIGGIAGWYRGRVRLVGVEPSAAPTLSRALAAGGPVDAPAGGIAADSLAPRHVGALMFPLAQQYVDRVVLVEDDEIVAAQRALWDVARIVAEPGGAAAFAALLSGRYQPAAGERVGVLVCGANTSAVDFMR